MLYFNKVMLAHLYREIKQSVRFLKREQRFILGIHGKKKPSKADVSVDIFDTGVTSLYRRVLSIGTVIKHNETAKENTEVASYPCNHNQFVRIINIGTCSTARTTIRYCIFIFKLHSFNVNVCIKV